MLLSPLVAFGCLSLSLAFAGGRDPAAGTDSSRAPLALPPAERLSGVFPDCRLTREQAEPFPCYSVHSAGDTLVGYVAASDDAGTTAQGFAGPVPVRVYLGPDGGVLDFDILRNCETPVYLKLAFAGDLGHRLRSYRPGRSAPVDAVTLATASSSAIIRSIAGVADRLFGVHTSPPPDPAGK
jgi:hypothetical protein